MRYQNDPDGTRLPIKLDSATNGEFIPRPLNRRNRTINQQAMTRADRSASRLGISRRQFLASSCGAAGTLLTMNQVNAAAGKTGSYYDLPVAAAMDTAAAESVLGQKDFILDIQGHHVNPVARWRAPSRAWLEGLRFLPHGRCDYAGDDPVTGANECFTGEAFAREMFLDSETDLAVLSFVPSTEKNMPLTNEEAAATRELVDRLDGEHRLLVHGRVIPNLDGDLERMAELKETWNISAWKTYTQYGPTPDAGWWLYDDHGQALAENARKLGVPVICIHKGLPLPPPMMSDQNLEYSSGLDVGRAARENPDISYIIYHSAHDTKIPEGPYDPTAERGVDSLIRSVQEAGLEPGANVYAELGSTWREWMKDPDQAAHGMGKLLKYLGEDNVVWGTDCIWYGSPQDQIQAFRSFQISAEYQEKYGYPAITSALRAKVFGLNAAPLYGIEPEEIRRHQDGDAVDVARANYANVRDPSFQTYGPKTRRQFLQLALSGDH